MKNEISVIKSGSIAEEMEIEIGDCLLSINGESVEDIIDYKYLICDEYVTIEVQKKDGEIWEIEIEKEYDEDLGVEFKEAILDKPKSCHNKCIFCFIDQLPKGMRETLYFKDDDSRLAFLQGNFVTLTNMNEDDINRIIKYKISPINVSVHTTSPELRVKMLNNRFAGEVYRMLKKMANAGIKINCQIVLCPGINDNEELEKTIEDLYKLHPNVENLAVVPVGATKFREGLYNINLYNKETASEQLQLVSRLQQKYIGEIGIPFVRMSDEFYILSQTEIPCDEFYDNFKQLEDGVGVTRAFRSNIKNSIVELKENISGFFTIVTGELAYNEIQEAANTIMKENSQITINVVKIINNFFGETITVAGLITATDIIEQLRDKQLGRYIIIPDCMLRKGYELASDTEKVFLDNITVEGLEKALERKILVCDYTGEDLVNIINKYCEEV